EAIRVQELPFETEIALHAVQRIAGHGKLDRGEVNADLVRAARLEPDIEKRVLGHELPHLEPGDGVARLLRIERPPGRIAPVPADRGVDPPAARARAAADEGEVTPFDLPCPDRLLECGVSRL